uniref:Uncharacterized protein n=1 Tax=Brassica oleracea var. oleracea TaxID=109376 RepID=A0A0D3EAW5_BRAOL
MRRSPVAVLLPNLEALLQVTKSGVFAGIENSLSKDLAVALNDSESPSSEFFKPRLSDKAKLHGELDTGRRQRLSPLVLSYTFGDTGRRQMELVQKRGKRDR